MSSVGLGLSGSIKAGAWAAPCCGVFWRKPSLVPDPPGRRGVSSSQWLPANFLAEASTRLTACTHVSLWLRIVVFFNREWVLLCVRDLPSVYLFFYGFIYFYMLLFCLCGAFRAGYCTQLRCKASSQKTQNSSPPRSTLRFFCSPPLCHLLKEEGLQWSRYITVCFHK